MQIALKDKINRIYITSTDPVELERAYKEIMDGYLENAAIKQFIKRSPNPDLQKEYGIYESLSMRLHIKELLLKYFIGYTDEDKRVLMDYVSSALDISCDKEYTKTTKILANARDFVDEVHDIMKETVAAINRVRDSSGEIATDNTELIVEAADTIKKTLTAAKEIETKTIFPEGVIIPDLAAKIVQDLEEESEWFSTQLTANQSEAAVKLLAECVKPLNSSGYKTTADYYENPVDRSKVTARAIVISTPFLDEAMLYAGVYSGYINQNMHILFAEKLLECKNRGVSPDALMCQAKAEGLSFIVIGIDKLSGEFLEDVKLAFLRAAHNGTHILIMNNAGGRALYESMDKLAATDSNLSTTDIYHAFLTMPSFNAVIRVLSDNGYISTGDSDTSRVRAALPFMGFVGLNTILRSDLSSPWFELAKARSDENMDLALQYLSTLFAPRQLIDDGWGNFAGHVRFVKGEKKHFDYDDLHGLDKENIRMIMEKSGISTFDRCGLIVKYCLLSGNDVSAWPKFSAEEQTKRASTATKMVAKVLDTSYTPSVEIVPEEKWEKKEAGGYCADGGKRIVYRQSCVQNYAWMEDSVCHECFHAFQHTATDSPYADWFFTELGVTQGRIAQWDDNFKVYVGAEGGVTYRVEIVECDAKAFALDCLRNVENYWKDIDFN